MTRFEMVMGAVLFCTLAVRAEAPLDVGSRKQLFIDKRFIAKSQGVELRMNPAQKLGLILDDKGQSWPEFQHVSRVFEDQGIRPSVLRPRAANQSHPAAQPRAVPAPRWGEKSFQHAVWVSGLGFLASRASCFKALRGHGAKVIGQPVVCEPAKNAIDQESDEQPGQDRKMLSPPVA